MEQITFGAIIEIISGLGTVGVLLWLAAMFQRGDILSRRVYEDLTTRILNELCTQVVREIREVLTALEEKEKPTDL